MCGNGLTIGVASGVTTAAATTRPSTMHTEPGSRLSGMRCPLVVVWVGCGRVSSFLLLLYLYYKVVCGCVCFFPHISVLHVCRHAQGPTGMVRTLKNVKFPGSGSNSKQWQVIFTYNCLQHYACFLRLL